MDRSRLEAFSDGVFAVAITLLALNFVVDGPVRGHNHLLHDLGLLWPSFLAYLVSFFMIGIIWVNHHVLVRAIRTVDRTLLFLNLVLLLFVVLIPFATSTVARYKLASTLDGRVSVAFYAAVFFGMSLGFSAIFEWTLHGERMHQPLPPEQHWPARIRFVSGGLVYLVAFGVALLNAVASFVIIAVVAVYYIFERTPPASTRAQGTDATLE
ncbi:MAG: DUF1211 domain-containing protein [Streptosporangiaceae bacterium]|nr:DUF1211 domain-containing protein [Streptosporangiaceae bacterium]